MQETFARGTIQSRVTTILKHVHYVQVRLSCPNDCWSAKVSLLAVNDKAN